MKAWLVGVALLMLSGLVHGDVAAKISFFSGRGAVDGLFYLNDGEAAEAKASTIRMDKPVSYKGAGELAFYESEQEAENGKAEPLFTARLPEKAKRVLIVFAEDEDGAEIALVFDFSDVSAKNSVIKFVNLSGKDLDAKVGEIATEIPDGGVGTVSKKDLEGDEVQMEVREDSGEEDRVGRLYYSSLLGVERKTHDFVMLMKSKSRARPIEARRLEESVNDH
ncbi:hypothetical protein [Haloferula sp.]|uniref:hypothetical protein n=1 Tax=Haloferula sp. TaxID=2497595 RepID=UPI00329DA853